MDPGTVEAVNKKLSGGLTMCGLTFKQADEKLKSITPYITPDGRTFGTDVVNYIVTQAP
jgi:hypothetical protein